MYQIYVRDCINYTLGTVSKHALGLGFGLGLGLGIALCQNRLCLFNTFNKSEYTQICDKMKQVL